jgi:hypothetical protein
MTWFNLQCVWSKLKLARIIHEGFYSNCRYETRNHLEVSDSRAKIYYRMALDLASAVATRLACEVEGKVPLPAHI